MSVQYPDLPLLRSVLAAVSLPREGGGGGDSADTDNTETTESDSIQMGGRPISPFNLMQLAPFMRKIAAGSPTDGKFISQWDIDRLQSLLRPGVI